MKKILISIWYKIISFPFRLMPIKNNRIVFSVFFGKGYGDSQKYIADELIKRGGYEIIWAVNDLSMKGFPKEVKKVKNGSISKLFYLSTARVWVDNSRKSYGLKKRKGQFYIQTWHSSLRLKKIERDAEKYLTKDYIKSAKNDSKMIDIITSGCRFSTNIYKNSFWYDGEVYECGTARCDILFDKEESQKIRRKICDLYHIDSAKKLVLYAPTFRNDKIFDNRYLDCEKLSKKLGNDYEVLLRLHPNMSKSEVKNKNIVDVTKYPDMQELICASDFLITDYSGCCFDMMIAQKPCILYTPDLEQFLSNERELYFSFDELPFDKIISEPELVKQIITFDYKKYYDDIKAFGEKIGLCEHGDASKKIADLIEEKCKKA